MAITTYDELQTAIGNWLDREDLTDRIPEFIALAEADINAEFDLRTIESDQSLTPVSGSRYIPVPTGFREAKNLWIVWPNSGRAEMRAVTPETIMVSAVSSVPSAWCVDGTNIAFNCPANSDSLYSFVLRMLGGVALSDSSPTNLVLTNYPNVYLYQSLKHAAPFLRDPEALVMFSKLADDALAAAKSKEFRTKSLTTLSTEPGVLTFYGSRRGFNIIRGY